MQTAENFLAPVILPQGIVDIFIRDHSCMCGSHLLAKFAPGRMFQVYCPVCGDVTKTMCVKKYVMRQAESDAIAAGIDLRAAQRRLAQQNTRRR